MPDSSFCCLLALTHPLLLRAGTVSFPALLNGSLVPASGELADDCNLGKINLHIIND